MKPLLKIVLGLAGFVLVLVVGLALAVAVLFDKKDFQMLLAESVTNATGRQFTLDGNLGLDYFPCCSVTLGHAALGNPEGFPDGDFASVQGAALSLRIWPLLTRGSVEIGTVRLQGLSANLVARKDGAANWEFAGGTAGEQTGGEAETGPERLAIEGIEIRSGRVTYRDEASGASYLAEDIELDTGDVTPGKPFDLELTTKLTDQADGTSGTVKLVAATTLAADLARIDLANPRLDVTAAGQAIPAKSLTAKLGAAALAVEFRQDTQLQFTGLQGDFSLPGLEAAAGDVKGSFSAGDTSLAFGASSELIVPQLQADVTVSGKAIPGEVITTKLATGKISLDVDKLRASVESLSAEVSGPGARLTASDKAAPAKPLKAKLDVAGVLAELGEARRARLTGLNGEFVLPGLEAMPGDVAGSFTAGDVSVALGRTTTLTVPKLAADVAVSGPGIPGDVITTRLTASVLSYDVDEARGSVESLAADVNGLGARLAVTGKGRFDEGDPNLAGTLAIDPLSPRSVLALLQEPEPKIADPQALTRLAGRANWALGKDSLALSGLDLQLDQTRLTGSFSRDDGDRPFMRFDLVVDSIDLDRYLPPEAGDGGSGTPGIATEPDDIPVDLLRDLRLDGNLKLARLVYAKAKLADVRVGVRAADGRVRLEPLAANLYGGSYQGMVGIDATGPVAKLAVAQKINGLQVGNILRDLYQTDRLVGALSGTVDLTATGNGSGALLRTLNGGVAVNIADGAYLGTDLWYEIRRARALVKSDPPPPVPGAPQTKFNALEVAGRLNDGVLAADRLLAEIPFTRLTGQGTLNLVEKTLDYRLQAQVFANPSFEDGSSIKDLKGLAIPLTLQGPMDKPKVGVDLKGVAFGAATEKLRERVLKKLGEPQPAANEGATAEQAPPADQAAPAEEPKQEEKPRDVLKRGLRDLLKNQ